ncbi:MAG: ABC transporter substrate-binding protein [Spirochaetia bacterium]
MNLFPRTVRIILTSSLFFFLVCFSLFPSGQNEGSVHQDTGSPYPLSVIDSLGTEVEILREPVQICSVALAADEILLSLVSTERITALSSFSVNETVSNVADTAQEIDHHITFSAEQIITLGPDLVICADWTDAAGVQLLRDAGITVFQMKTASTFAEVRENIRMLGLITNTENEAAELIQWTDSILEQAAELSEEQGETGAKSVMEYSSWGTAGSTGTTWHEIILHAGCTDPLAEYESDQFGFVPVSQELILTIDPDIIILPDWIYGEEDGADEFYQEFHNNPAFSRLSALETGNVYRIPERWKSSTSQYMARAALELARLAYGDQGQ